MKKYFALIISTVIILTCFTACKPELQNGALVTNANSEVFAAVTEADGGIARDEAGNIIVLVTDEDGRNVKDENGEYQTNPVALQHALVVGNRIECPRFAMTIPNGWSDKMSFSDLIISKDGTKDVLLIAVTDETTLKDEIEAKSEAITAIKSMHPSAESGTKEVTISENISAQFTYAFVEDTGYRDENGTVLGSYLGYIIFRNNSAVYSCRISSDRDMTPQLDEITEILGTIEFIY